MGIRIKKQLGYGLTDLKIEHLGKLSDDPRINPEFTDEEFYNDKLHTHEFFLEFCEWMHKEFEKDRKNNECSDLIRKANGWDEDEFFIGPYGYHEVLFPEKHKREGFRKEVLGDTPFFEFNSEFGLSNVICFGEPLSPDWSRYDDTIYYYMSESAEPNVVDLMHRCGIYPYISVIQIPGSNLPDPWRKKYAPSEYNMMTGRWDEDRKPDLSGEHLEIALNCYRPIIPDSILLWTYYIGIFKDWEKTVQELRPMIYTYWS